LKGLVDQTPTLQCTINLAIAGQESCSANIESPAALLDALKRHQNAWDELKWSRQSRLPMRSGGLWELYGGVLAQSDEEGGIYFFRLPSDLRSIEEKQWSLGPSLSCPVRDFGMDPSQDLLLLIESPRWCVISSIFENNSIDFLVSAGWGRTLTILTDCTFAP
jgi:hypothetical protein